MKLLCTKQYAEQGSEEKMQRDFLVIQWLRVHLPGQGTRVRSLVGEDPVRLAASEPGHRNC